MLRVFENELANWSHSLKKMDSHDFVGRYKELAYKCVAFPLRINAPLKNLRERLKLKGVLTKSNKPVAVSRMINQPNHVIVGWFCSIAQGFLNYYRCCSNFSRVKNYIDYFVRWSAIHTLAKKHRSSCSDIISKLSKNIIILDSKGYQLADFPSNHFIKLMGRKFLMGIDFNAGLLVLNSIWLKFSCFKWFGLRCAFKDCNEISIIEMFNTSELSRIKNSFGFVSVVTKKKKQAIGVEAFKIVSNCSEIPFCKKHYQYLCTTKINCLDLDWDYLKNFE
jgi:Type II intron maturase